MDLSELDVFVEKLGNPTTENKTAIELGAKIYKETQYENIDIGD